MSDVVIVGGGITGLASAYLMAKAGKSVTLIEGSSEFGGLLRTFEVGGTRLEYYYHHFFTHDAELHWLIKELDLEHLLVYKKSTMGIYRRGRIYPFNNVADLFKFSPLTLIDKFRFGLTSAYLGKLASWQKSEEISSLQWFYSWLGKNATESIWAPLLNIKFGSYASKVPLAWMIGRLRQRMNSRKKGDEQLGYLKGSLHVLLSTLLERLKELNVELIADSPINQVIVKDNKITSVVTTKGSFEAHQFLFTIPGTYLAKILKDTLPEVAKRITEIEYFGAVCVILELDRPLSKTYWLNVADENFPFGGIIEHTNFISPKEYNGSHIAYLSRYFGMSEDIAAMSEEQIADLMLNAMPRIYEGFSRDWIKKVSVFKTATAATVCDLSFSKKVPPCQTEINNLFVVNMSHIYPDERSTNNSIRIAAEACRTMGTDTSYVPKNSSLSGQIGFL